MSKVFFDVGISLDGFIAGENRGPKNPLGDGGTTIHQWMFNQKAFWETHNIESGKEDGPDGDLIRNVFARTGAYIMGKRMFDEGEPNWPEDLFKEHVYVLTHEKRNPWVQKGTTTFHFINDGIDAALTLARAKANGKDIRLQGGADMIQQYLNAGVVDEFTLHIAPVLIGSGVRLLENVDKKKVRVIVTSSTTSPLANHVNFKIVKKTSSEKDDIRES